jgi:hypothetical protein
VQPHIRPADPSTILDAVSPAITAHHRCSSRRVCTADLVPSRARSR